MRLTDEECMEVARMASQHADCKKSHVGAVLVLSNGHLITGRNASPTSQLRCADGGCYRCSHPELFGHGERYDLCTCVHAEEDCLTDAAKCGVNTEGATLYCTLRPCRGCSKLLLQAGVRAVYYEKDLPVGNEAEQQAYETLQAGFPDGVHQLGCVEMTQPMLPDAVSVSVPLSMSVS